MRKIKKSIEMRKVKDSIKLRGEILNFGTMAGKARELDMMQRRNVDIGDS